MEQNFWKNYWTGLYATPRAWAHKGENLIHAFEAVASASVEGSLHLNMRDQALMLAGMAIEVQLKAILVNLPEIRDVVIASKKSLDTSEKSLQNVFYSHRLVALSRAAGVTLTPDQMKIADTLTQYIYWRGRYVLPTENGLDDLASVMLENGLIGQPHRSATIESARELINYIIAEVKTRLYGQKSG